MSMVAAGLPDARVLDLFAGSGALGLEALSRGAAHATFVEQSPEALRTLGANLAALAAVDRATVVRGDAIRYVRRLEASAFDLAFADPPYGRGFARALVDRFLENPFAALLCIEHGPRDLDEGVPNADTRRYGDTRLTLIPAPT
jgi:16S rRNA (guanine966-N2)-methyltransferase